MELIKGLLAAVLITMLFMSCSGKEEEGPVPELSISAPRIAEGNGNGLTSIQAEAVLSVATTREVSFSVSTADITARAGEDYEALDNQLVRIPAGQTRAVILLQLKADDDLELDESFRLSLSGLINATFPQQAGTVYILNDDSYRPEKAADGFITPDEYPGWELVWSDEFDAAALNTGDWTYELGDGCPNVCGWGNNELEVYTDSEKNVFLEDGILTIKAMDEGGGRYTSGRIITKGKRKFRFGRIDIRAKLPLGQGIWPALWMLGENIDQVGWPSCGEIDIMELVGHQPAVVHGTAHYNGAGGHQFRGGSQALLSGGTYADEYHIFTILWQENAIRWLVDYQEFFTINSQEVSPYPFNNDFFFIFNVAVGGNWPGNPDETTVFPQSMEVDYVRVFQ